MGNALRSMSAMTRGASITQTVSFTSRADSTPDTSTSDPNSVVGVRTCRSVVSAAQSKKPARRRQPASRNIPKRSTRVPQSMAR